MPGPFGGATFIADASAWNRAAHPRVAGRWTTALRNRQYRRRARSSTWSSLYSARDREEFDDIAASLAQLRDVPLTRSVTNAAQRAYQELAAVRPRNQRSVRLPDLLIAACAQDSGIGVLHYDDDFDRLAEVLAFESRWIARRGSL